MDFLLYIFASIGLTWLVVDSTIAAPIKNWVSTQTWLPQWFKDKFASLTSCYQCSGFWCGMIVAIILLLCESFPLLKILLYGFAASWLSPLGYLSVSYLNMAASNFGQNHDFDDEEDDDYYESNDSDE